MTIYTRRPLTCWDFPLGTGKRGLINTSALKTIGNFFQRNHSSIYFVANILVILQDKLPKIYLGVKMLPYCLPFTGIFIVTGSQGVYGVSSWMFTHYSCLVQPSFKNSILHSMVKQWNQLLFQTTASSTDPLLKLTRPRSNYPDRPRDYLHKLGPTNPLSIFPNFAI